MTEGIIIYTRELEDKIREELGRKCTPEFLNLIRIAIATHEHAFAEFGISKEKYLEWVNKAWDAGVHQRKVYDMKVGGCINNEWGVTLNFGAYLSLFGQEEGYLCKKYCSASGSHFY